MKEDMKSIIFVFGSNLAGQHGAGAAKHALMYWEAKYNVGEGRQGYAYGIPTKDRMLKTLPLEQIAVYVDSFLKFAKLYPMLDFQVTAVGCGLAGLTPEQVAPLFKGATPNVHLPLGWREIISGESYFHPDDFAGGF